MLKRFLGIVGLIVLALVFVVGGLLTVTFVGRRGVTTGQEIGGAQIVADGFTSLAIVPVGDKAVLLVDAGEDAAGEAVLAALASRQLTPDAVRAVLVTHGHPDHIGAIPLFSEAEVMALAAEAPLVEGRAGSRGPVTRFFPVNRTGVTVTRALRDGETFKVGDTSVRVFATPGHTAGSAAYLINGVLFVGDSADVSRDGEIRGAPWIFSDSQEQNRASLRRLVDRLAQERIDVRAIVPAHSGVVEGLAPLTAFARADAP